MSIEPIWEGDSLTLRITVVTENGAPKDLSGAVVSAAAEKGVVVNAVSAVVTDGPNGVITAIWNGGDLEKGTWNIQVRYAKGSEIETVYVETVQVNKSVL